VPIRVVPYDPRWPDQFRLVRTALEAALAGIPVIGIEHVGSTSVPGLAAKPVIDVDVVVSRDHLVRAIGALLAAGYAYRGDLGIPDRHAMEAPDNEPDRHVYVVVNGALALRNHLLLRDALRADPARRDAYGRLKLELARRHADSIDAYVAGKTDLIVSELAAAGLTDEEREAIAAVNRGQAP
jgi:GrpB-like predicted nucleotidyltransferase (UPF0157 family)